MESEQLDGTIDSEELNEMAESLNFKQAFSSSIMTPNDEELGQSGRKNMDGELDCEEQSDDNEEHHEKPFERKKVFAKQLAAIIYGFGGSKEPYQETVDLLDELVLEFITRMTIKATDIGRAGKVNVEDIIFLVRKEPTMYSRIRELLTINTELKNARKAFDEIKYI